MVAREVRDRESSETTEGPDFGDSEEPAAPGPIAGADGLTEPEAPGGGAKAAEAAEPTEPRASEGGAEGAQVAEPEEMGEGSS